jgi:Ino eighty subunit 2
MDTINRLLKKQPPKRGKRAIQDDNSGEDDGEVEKANPLYVRYTQTVNGTRMAVPEEWLNSPAGSVFAGDMSKPSHRPYGHRMVEEVA